jgi:hypothetical protein
VGFNKKYITLSQSLECLKNDTLDNYYGNNDSLVFDCNLSDFIYQSHIGGMSNVEILIMIKKNMEVNNEMY